MKNSFEVSMDFFRKIQQFFMSDFLHSKFPKMRWICGMSRADDKILNFFARDLRLKVWFPGMFSFEVQK